eukprot:7089773-Prymnesium_polylepis.1
MQFRRRSIAAALPSAFQHPIGGSVLKTGAGKAVKQSVQLNCVPTSTSSQAGMAEIIKVIQYAGRDCAHTMYGRLVDFRSDFQHTAAHLESFFCTDGAFNVKPINL